MKDHQIAALVNEVTRKVSAICPDAPQSLREVIRKPIVEALKCDHDFHFFGSQPTRRCNKCGTLED